MDRPTPSRLIAAFAFLVGASLLLITAGLAIPLAAYVLESGVVPASPSDVRTAESLMPFVPVLVGIAALQAAAGIGLLVGRGWARPLAILLAVGWSAAWVVALVATVAGWGPFDPSLRPDPAASAWSGATLSAAGIVGSLLVAGALLWDALADRRASRAEAALS